MFELKRKSLIGVVNGDKCNKTRTVLIERTVMHPLYKKEVTKKKKIMVHDENNKSKLGDVVRISAYRPTSKKKRWSLVEILESKI